MKLPSELKTRVNKLAHAAGVAHGERVKRNLLAEIERRMNAGKRQDAMLVLRALTDAELSAMILTDAELSALAITEAELTAWAD